MKTNDPTLNPEPECPAPRGTLNPHNTTSRTEMLSGLAWEGPAILLFNKRYLYRNMREITQDAKS